MNLRESFCCGFTDSVPRLSLLCLSDDMDTESAGVV